MKGKDYDTFYERIDLFADELQDITTQESLRNILGRKKILTTPKGKNKASVEQTQVAWEHLKGKSRGGEIKKYNFIVERYSYHGKKRTVGRVTGGKTIKYKGKTYKGGQFLPKSYYK